MIVSQTEFMSRRTSSFQKRSTRKPLAFSSALRSTSWFGLCMLAAVDLDHQLRIETNEVRDVFSDRNVAPELDMIEAPISQFVPQPVFGFGRLVPHRAGEATSCR